jgi:hypothetical protein
MAIPVKKSQHDGWYAACGVHRWARPKEFAQGSGAANSPAEGSPFIRPTA